MRKLMCRIGWHSTFTQDDKWGVARVCRYCKWNEALSDAD